MDKKKNVKVLSEKKIKWTADKIEKQVTKKLEKKVGKQVADGVVNLTKTIIEECKSNPSKSSEAIMKVLDKKEK